MYCRLQSVSSHSCIWKQNFLSSSNGYRMTCSHAELKVSEIIRCSLIPDYVFINSFRQVIHWCQSCGCYASGSLCQWSCPLFPWSNQLATEKYASYLSYRSYSILDLNSLRRNEAHLSFDSSVEVQLWKRTLSQSHTSSRTSTHYRTARVSCYRWWAQVLYH